MSRLNRLALACSSAIVAWGIFSFTNTAEGQNAAQVVIDGGTLIDGNGGAPVRDAQIVIQANRIVKIGKKGDAIPAGARVIRGDGKWIVPGLFDSQLNFYSYQGEAMLNHGVTSFIGYSRRNFVRKNRISPDL